MILTPYSYSLSITAARAGLGTWADKVVYLCRSKYQNVTSSYTGSQYTGTALGTFTGSFYGNTTTYTISGDLFTAMAAYMAAGNNTFTLYNPSPTASSQGYSTNYFQWDSVTLTVTYQEAVSVPTVSSSSVTLGSAEMAVKLGVLGLFYIITAPISGHAIAKGAYHHGVRPEKKMKCDKYGEDLE